jgi:hypothetical protein
MVAYSCQKQFEAPIKAGFKTHTIRAVGKRRHARVGERMKLYAAMRTKHCRLILEATCVAVLPVRLSFDSAILTGASVDGAPVGDIDAFAISDGFADAVEMGRFWAASHALITGNFEGLLIEWAALPEEMK